MANNPFKQTPPVEDVKRNSFDLSFSNNLTLPIGKLVPVMCKEVIAGDSFEIDANFGLRFMPTVFPVQNRIRADLHFFYVRNRNLWSNWMDFFGNTWSKQTALVAPYIGAKDQNSDFFAEGSLSDYLGVPTSSVSSVGGARQDPIKAYIPSQNEEGMYTLNPNVPSYNMLLRYFRRPFNSVGKDYVDIGGSFHSYVNPTSDRIYVIDDNPMLHTISSSAITEIKLSALPGSGLVIPADCYAHYIDFLTYKNGAWHSLGFYTSTSNPKKVVLTVNGPKKWDDFMQTIDPEKTYLGICFNSSSNGFQYLLDYAKTITRSDSPKESKDFSGFRISLVYSGYNYDSGGVANANATYNPNYLPISALPYRAYESIFNAFYRNERIDPLLDADGDPMYNKYLQNDGDGVDDFPYTLHNRYWEKDFLTTALPSPQMGNAPLIGLAQNERPFVSQKMTLKPANGVNDEYTVTVQSDPDSKQVIGMSYYSENIPLGSVEALQEAITYGISINDFRNVNALQRWLEKSQARGYKYKDQLLSHFGVNVKFEQLNMPEFII